jgi:hypothetical protein
MASRTKADSDRAQFHGIPFEANFDIRMTAAGAIDAE